MGSSSGSEVLSGFSFHLSGLLKFLMAPNDSSTLLSKSLLSMLRFCLWIYLPPCDARPEPTPVRID